VLADSQTDGEKKKKNDSFSHSNLPIEASADARCRNPGRGHSGPLNFPNTKESALAIRAAWFARPPEGAAPTTVANIAITGRTATRLVWAAPSARGRCCSRASISRAACSVFLSNSESRKAGGSLPANSRRRFGFWLSYCKIAAAPESAIEGAVEAGERCRRADIFFFFFRKPSPRPDSQNRRPWPPTVPRVGEPPGWKAAVRPIFRAGAPTSCNRLWGRPAQPPRLGFRVIPRRDASFWEESRAFPPPPNVPFYRRSRRRLARGAKLFPVSCLAAAPGARERCPS